MITADCGRSPRPAAPQSHVSEPTTCRADRASVRIPPAVPVKHLSVRLRTLFATSLAAVSIPLIAAASASANSIGPEYGGSPNANSIHSLYMIVLTVGLITFVSVEGLLIWVIWRYDREEDEIPDVFGELGETPIFVITAY